MLRSQPLWKSSCKKDIKFEWTPECQERLDILKEKMVTAPILVFRDCNKEFHVDVHASSIFLGIVLAQSGEGNVDHPIAFASRKLSTPEKKLYYDRTRRSSYGLCIAEVLTLSVRISF